MEKPYKVLVIQTAFLGDVVLATGVLESIHHRYPSAEIHFLLRKGNESLFREHPFVARVWVYDKSSKISEVFRLIKAFRKEKFDAIFNLQRFFISGLMKPLVDTNYTY
jgi:heptosyltransferase-2